MNNVQLVTLPLGGFNGATEVPLAYLPDVVGGVTILSAKLVGPAAGTVVGGLLVTMSDAGTPALDGTIGAFAGTCVTKAGERFNCTISTAYVAGGKWLGFDQTSGTVPAGTFISVAYVVGK